MRKLARDLGQTLRPDRENPKSLRFDGFFSGKRQKNADFFCDICYYKKSKSGGRPVRME